MKEGKQEQMIAEAFATCGEVLEAAAGAFDAFERGRLVIAQSDFRASTFARGCRSQPEMSRPLISGSGSVLYQTQMVCPLCESTDLSCETSSERETKHSSGT